MRYRMLSPSGDYVFGQGRQEFWVDSAEGVAQAVQTRLLLAQGDWFLDLIEGTPYATQILGAGTRALYDQAIRTRILGTPGVLSIIDYTSDLDDQRHLSVRCTIQTQYGPQVFVAGLRPPTPVPTGSWINSAGLRGMWVNSVGDMGDWVP
jgi:hypothetical protein